MPSSKRVPNQFASKARDRSHGARSESQNWLARYTEPTCILDSYFADSLIAPSRTIFRP